MAQLKIAQISGLLTALGTKVETGTNLGATGVGIFASKSGTSLQFNKLVAGNGIVGLSVNSNVITISVDVGVGADKILQLDGSARIPAVDGSLLTNLNPANIVGVSGALPLTNLALAQGQFYIGNASNNPTNIAKSAIPLSGFGVPTNDIDIGARKLYTSASSWAANELVPKSYVDAAVAGNLYKPAARVLSKSNINISGPGSSIDGITMALDNRVVLVGQTNPEENGVWLWKGAAVPMVRAADADQSAELTNLTIFIQEGTYAFETYKLITTGPITVGLTALEFTQIGGQIEIGTGDGLAATGSTFYVVGDNVTIGIVNSKVAVKSTNVNGQVLLSNGNNVQAAVWGAVDLANTNATTGILPVNRGGTSLNAVAQHSLLAAITAPNTIAALTLSMWTVLGRKTGNIAGLTKADLRELLGLRPVIDRANAVNGNMKLITLSQTPDDATKVTVIFRGIVLDYNVDYTISGTDVNATNALNVAYGGSGSNGLGFANDDAVIAVYTY